MSEEKVEYKVTHGGFRTGAGRKTKYEKTVVMRVPEKYKVAIKMLNQHLDDCEMIDKNCSIYRQLSVNDFILSIIRSMKKLKTYIQKP